VEAYENIHVPFVEPNFMLLDANRVIPLLASPPCIFIKISNNTSTEQLISGTYCHPVLIPRIACWVSADFAASSLTLFQK